MSYFERKRHDTDGPFVFQVFEDDGTPANLSALTSLTITMKTEDETVTKINNAAATAPGDGLSGIVQYQPLAADVDTAGTFKLEIEAVRPGRGKKTWPTKKGGLRLIIHPDLNNA